VQEPVRLRFEGDARAVNGCLLNLSVGGAFIRCSTPVELGRPLKCAFLLAHDTAQDVVVCEGTVRWVPSVETLQSIGPGFGMEFTKLAPKIRCFLEVVTEDRLNRPAADA
jgi:hypothetical protein